MKLKFYEVDSEYIKYLKENGDNKIPNIEKDIKFQIFFVLSKIVAIAKVNKSEEKTKSFRILRACLFSLKVI